MSNKTDHSRMKKPWKNPVKGVPAKESTMSTQGNFGQFTELMKRVVEKKSKTSASRVPDAS
jgi:hypothetical protein